MTGFLEDQIREQKKGSVYLPAIRRVRMKEIETRREEYSWGAPDYKIYPSSIKSWSMCPKEFLSKRSTYEGIVQLAGITRTRRGSSIHRELQEDFKYSDKICPFPDNITDPRMVAKLTKNWPEIPFHNLKTGVSGSVDSVMLWRGEILPVEIKTTNYEDYEKWAVAKVEKFPDKYTAWIIQICIYMYHLREANYWPEHKLDKALLVVINSCMDPTNLDGEYEEVVNYSEYRGRTEALMEHIALQRQAYIDNVNTPCTYPFCKAHKEKL